MRGDGGVAEERACLRAGALCPREEGGGSGRGAELVEEVVHAVRPIGADPV